LALFTNKFMFMILSSLISGYNLLRLQHRRGHVSTIIKYLRYITKWIIIALVATGHFSPLYVIYSVHYVSSGPEHFFFECVAL
jgi:hypothetical protein